MSGFLYKKFRSKCRKKRVPSPYKKAFALLVSVMSVYIRTRGARRNHGKCEICGTGPIQCCFHFQPSRWLAVRFHPDNMAAACHPCNFGEMIQRGSAHDDVIRAAHIRIVGEERVLWIEEHKRDPWKKSAEQLLDMKREIERKLAVGEF